MAITFTAPESFAGALDEVCYTVSGLDPQAVTQIEILNTDNNRLLGVKEFRGQESVRVNVARYARQLLDIVPQIYNQNIVMINNTGRYVSLCIRSCGSTSPVTKLVYSSFAPIQTGIMTTAPEKKHIAWNETDEICFCSPGNRYDCIATLTGSGELLEFQLAESMAINGIGTLRLNASRLNDLVLGKRRQPDEFNMIEVNVRDLDHNSETRIVQFYKIVPESPSGMRVCWVNPFGGIDYHTFPIIKEDELRPEKSSFYGNNGTQIISPGVRMGTTLSSGRLPKGMLQWLGDIAGSPRIWFFPTKTRTYIPVVVSSQSIKLDGLQPGSIEISFQMAKTSLSHSYEFICR